MGELKKGRGSTWLNSGMLNSSFGSGVSLGSDMAQGVTTAMGLVAETEEEKFTSHEECQILWRTQCWWVEYASGLRGLSVALEAIQAFVQPCFHSEVLFFFSLSPFLSSNKS